MKLRLILSFALLFSSLMVATTSAAQTSPPHIPCPGCGQVDHDQILENAALAELAYTATQPNTRNINIFQHCQDPKVKYDTSGARTVEISQLPGRILAKAEMNLRQDFDSHDRGYIDIRRVPDNKLIYYVCDRRQEAELRLAVSFYWMYSNNKIALSYSVAFVAKGESSQQESVQAISLFNDKALGIPGTNPGQPANWVASLNQLRLLSRICG